jgi:hypothetical protein
VVRRRQPQMPKQLLAIVRLHLFSFVLCIFLVHVNGRTRFFISYLHFYYSHIKLFME